MVNKYKESEIRNKREKINSCKALLLKLDLIEQACVVPDL